jgi:hypothetical protein
MELRGHCHFAQVFFEFESLGATGFPSFEHTHAEIRAYLVTLTAKPFRACTNEAVLRRLFDFFREVELKETRKYGTTKYRLAGMELHVRGVPDDIGHADTFTVYKIKE